MEKVFLIFLLFLSSCNAKNLKSYSEKDIKKELSINLYKKNPCSKIVYKQIKGKYKKVLEENMGSSSYTFSLSILGPSFSLTLNPYLDEKEVLNLKLKIFEDVEKYSRNLENYLITLRKYLFLKKFYAWEKARIETGVDSIKENYSDIKEYEDTYSKLKAMEIKYEIYGIKRKELYNCYLYTYKDKITNPFELIKKDKIK